MVQLKAEVASILERVRGRISKPQIKDFHFFILDDFVFAISSFHLSDGFDVFDQKTQIIIVDFGFNIFSYVFPLISI